MELLIKELQEKIDVHYDRISTSLSEIQITLAVQAQQLKDHMRRTELLENQTESIKGQIRPLKRHVDLVNAICKISGYLLASSAALFGIIQVILKWK